MELSGVKTKKRERHYDIHRDAEGRRVIEKRTSVNLRLPDRQIMKIRQLAEQRDANLTSEIVRLLDIALAAEK
jgi:predicted DNA binding CopG/RHH family protein